MKLIGVCILLSLFFACKRAISQIEIFEVIPKMLTENNQYDSIYLNIYDIKKDTSFCLRYCYWSLNNIARYSEFDEALNLTYDKRFSYDSLHNLTQERVINVSNGQIDYYNYINFYSNKKLMKVYVPNSNIIINYQYNFFGTLKKMVVDTQKDNIEYIFGYKKKFFYDFDHDIINIYSYKKGQLNMIESHRYYLNIVTCMKTYFEYNKSGYIIGKYIFEEDLRIKDEIYEYDQQGRITNIKYGVYEYKFNYQNSKDSDIIITLYRNDTPLFKLNVDLFVVDNNSIDM